jgi:ribonucleoside-diphosphate reductase alpha chain
MINRKHIKVDYSRDALFDEMGLRRLKDSYMAPNEKSPQDRFSYVARALSTDAAMAQRIYDYISQHWLSLATPILSYGASKKGLPISCYLAFVDDTADALVNTQAEANWLSMLGGGVGLGIGIRSEDHRSVGVMPHLKTYEANSLAYRQGKTRRGSFAAYLSISHPNVKQFIDMRKPTGDANMRCLELHHGVNITDDFMQLIKRCMQDTNADDSWDLIDPHSGKVKETVSARELWTSILETRMRTGEPYIHYIDASNRGLPDFQKKLGLKVQQSNICTEITLATDADRTAVCCLASGNLEYWDKWKDNYQFHRDIAELLDNVLTLFIKKAPKEISRAAFSATRERAIGFGALGWHALLQQKSIAWESATAVSLNKRIFKRIREFFDRASYELAIERGPCPDAADSGVMERFSHKLAIAPNASTSIIMGNTSASTEAFRANAYRQDTLSGLFLNKNKYLDAILKLRCSDAEYVKAWQVIVTSSGSCQSLDCLTNHEKEVFKTASEIDQLWTIQHAADRQEFIDQSQSVNLFFKADVSVGYLHHVHYKAWEQNLKTLYYCRSDKLYSGESEHSVKTEVNHTFSAVVGDSDCLACE